VRCLTDLGDSAKLKANQAQFVRRRRRRVANMGARVPGRASGATGRTLGGSYVSTACGTFCIRRLTSNEGGEVSKRPVLLRLAFDAFPFRAPTEQGLG